MIRKQSPETLLASMEIIFVTGKGGVGKSAVAAALALNKSMDGRRTLLVELGDQSFYSDYFELGSLGYQSHNLRKNLDIALWSGADCLKEYALHLLKIQSLYKLFFENAVSKALMSVAPALPELAILGKITSGPPRNVGPKMPYDTVVVDAYASGHFVALLKAPQGMASVIGFGPMGEQSRAIDKVLQSPDLCKYYVISQPEELPIVEALELAANIKTITGLPVTHLLNRVLEIPDEALMHKLENPPENLDQFRNYLKNRALRQKQFLATLQSHSASVFELPWVLHSDPWTVVTALAQALAARTQGSFQGNLNA